MNPTCILTDENIGTEDDCTTHGHEDVALDTRTGVRTAAEAAKRLDEMYDQWAAQGSQDTDDFTGEEFDQLEIELLRDLYQLTWGNL